MFNHSMQEIGPAMLPTANPVAEFVSVNSSLDPDRGRDNVDVSLLTSKMETLGVDSKSEEKQMQATIRVLVSFANDRANPVSEVPLANTTLLLSSTDWQVLVSGRPAEENSFRGELYCVLSRSVGLRAAMQEELALYKVRQTTAHLFKKHLCSLFYLAHESAILLPQLEMVSQCARSRGLTAKAEHLADTIRRMGRLVQQISSLNPSETQNESKVIRCDPKWQESRLQYVTAHLIAFAEAAAEPVSTIPLPNSGLPVSPTEWQALATACPSEERSFRADLHRVLRRTIGLLAAMQEECALYYSRRQMKFQWKRHLENLQYLSVNAHGVLPELKSLAEESRRRSLSGKYADLQLVITRLGERLEEISTLQ